MEGSFLDEKHLSRETVFLIHAADGKIAGFYRMPSGVTYLENFYVRDYYKKMGAVEILLQHLSRRASSIATQIRTVSFDSQSRRRFETKEFEGAIGGFRKALGIGSAARL